MKCGIEKTTVGLPQLEPFQPLGQEFERLLDDAQAGELLGLHAKTVQRLARAGVLPAVRIGRYWRNRASALSNWIDVNSSGQPACVDRERRI